MARHVLLLFTTWLLSVFAYDVHKHMTIEELRSTFHVDSHNLVPEYDLVHIHEVKRSKRSIDLTQENSVDDKSTANMEKFFKKNSDSGYSSSVRSADDRTSLKLSAFGKQLRLNLVPNQGLLKKGGLKIWTVEPNATSQHGVEYIEHPETNEHIGDIYQDEANQAAILLRNDATNGALIVEGSIGSDLIIRPLPQRLTSQSSKISLEETGRKNTLKENSTLPLIDDEMFLDAEENLSDEVAVDTGFPIRHQSENTPNQKHIIYKRRQNIQEDAYSDYAFMEPDHLSKRYKRSSERGSRKSRNKREAPYTIYPEILVIVDYDGYRLHGGDNLQIKRYFVSFWNGVDLRYKLLKGPKIRISIAGIIVSRGRDATPYLERNRVGRDAIDSAAALTDMGKYLFRERRLPVYDIAVAITKYDMCRRRKGGRCTKGTAGFAYVGGACVINKRLEKVNSVAIIEDTGGFSGIIVAAHEVGHLLGAVHDGSPPPSYLGGPGAQKCQWEDGYIMSDLRHTERGFRWSSCSVASFHHFLNGDTASCLYNPPHEDDSLPRVLPGKLLTLDAQCRRDRGTSACFKDDRVCAQLFCFDAGSGYCVAYRPAAEGSSCGDGQYCLNGRCVAEHENIIPDYSQNTPAYVRQDGSSSSGRSLYFNAEGNYNNNDNNNNNNKNNQEGNPFEQNTPQVPYHYNQYQNPTQSTPRTTQQSSSVTYRPFPYFSTTKSPYVSQHFSNRHDLYTTPTVKPVITSSTINPYIGNYYQLRQRTTKNPYDFADFGKNFKSTNDENDDNLNKNYLKRSYESDNFYMETYKSENRTENVGQRH